MAQEVVIEESPNVATLNQKFFDTQCKIEDVYEVIIATNLAVVRKAKEVAVAPMKDQLTKLVQQIPKLSDTALQDATVSAFRTAQAAKRKEIADIGLRKQINKYTKDFEKTGVITVTVPFGAEIIHKQVLAKKLLLEADMAQMLLAEAENRKADIKAQLGYVPPEQPHIIEY